MKITALSPRVLVRKRAAFTLIELLVVIAIIAILAAILFPVFARARAAARRTTGLSNMKQLGLGAMMYVQDYDERFPTWSWGESGLGAPGVSASIAQQNSPMIWYNAIYPYVKNVGIYQDPSDQKELQVEYGIVFPMDGRLPSKSTWLSYGANETMFQGRKLAAYANPASDLMIADGYTSLIDTWSRFDDWNYNGSGDLYVRRAIWTEGWTIQGENTPIDELKWQANLRWTRHGTGTNVAFGDGHAKLVQLRQLREVGPDNGQIIPGSGSRVPKF